MKAFMDKEFMLQSATAQHLYHDYAEDMPICDYHCHIPPREIYENRRFDNIAQVWLGGRNPDGSYFGDHYKWRVMRSNGVPEEYITGDKPDRERFQKFAEALPMAIGNPMYHWTNLELHHFFGYEGVLNGDTAEEVWNLCNDKLQHDPKLTVRGLIEQSNVAFIGTTDDPIDDLEWHKKIKEDPTIKFTVAPSFRPDKAINIQKPGFVEYMGKLAEVVGKEKLACIDCVCDALTKRIEFFVEMGCRATDHGLDYVPYREATKEEVNAIYQKAMAGEAVTVEEAEKYQTYILIHLGKQYHRLNVAMQIHYNCLRGVNRKMNSLLGPDTGFDMINTATCGGEIASLLSALNDTDECPKTIIYSLNPGDDAQIGTILGCFQNSEVPGKIKAQEYRRACHVAAPQLQCPGHVRQIGQQQPFRLLRRHVLPQGRQLLPPRHPAVEGPYRRGGQVGPIRPNARRRVEAAVQPDVLVRQSLFQRPVQPCADGPAVKTQDSALRQLLRQKLGQRRHARLAGAHQLYAAALQLPFRLQKVSPVRPQVCALPQHRQRSR